MIDAALDGLLTPVSEEAPCGPDLDMEGDPAFMNFMARAEGLLPASFVTVGEDGRNMLFDRSAIPYAEDSRTIAGFLQDTRDIRLLTILAKFAVLSRDLPTFTRCLDGIARLLGAYWAQVHPNGDMGDFMLRLVTLQSLDDIPTVVMPLQYLPLVTSRRFGNVTFRNVLIARGEIAAGDGEEAVDLAAIDSALSEADLEGLVALRDRLSLLRSALERCQALWIENAGYDEALTFPRLLPLVLGIERWLDEAVGRRDPSARTLAEDTGPTDELPQQGATTATPASASTVATMAAASQALSAAVLYFARHEPASPSLLLLRQAQALVGKPFHEILSTLLPNRFEEARIPVATDVGILLPVSMLAAHGDLSAIESEAGSSDGWGSQDSSESTSGDGSWDSWGSSSGEAASDASEEAEAPGEEAETTDGVSDSDDAAAQETDAEGPAMSDGWGDGSPATRQPPAPDAPASLADDRLQCLALISAVARFYRTAEPASPVPLLLDRAASLATKDFAALLKDFLPSHE